MKTCTRCERQLPIKKPPPKKIAGKLTDKVISIRFEILFQKITLQYYKTYLRYQLKTRSYVKGVDLVARQEPAYLEYSLETVEVMSVEQVNAKSYYHWYAKKTVYPIPTITRHL